MPKAATCSADSSGRSSFCVVGFLSPMGFAILGILLCAFSGSSWAEQTTNKNILLLFSAHDQRSQFLELFESSVRQQFSGQLTFYEGYVDFPYDEKYNTYLKSEAETFHLRYSGLKLDLVAAVGPSARKFVSQYRAKMFPGVPIVFTMLPTAQFGGKTWPGMTGLTEPVGLRETIELALRLQPDTTTVAVISPGARDSYWFALTHSELLRHKVREINFSEPFIPSPDLLEKVTALPPHTVVLFHLAVPESGQPPLEGMDLIDAVAQRVPTYSAWARLCLDHGCIGGVYKDDPKAIASTAKLAARVLSGERPDDIPIVQDSDLQTRVDWRALQRWHIPESALPPGSLVLWRKPSLWEQGRKYFLAAIMVIVSQALLIFGLLWQRARKRKTEAELRKSEEKFSKSFRQSPLAVTITNIKDARFIEVNEAFERDTGWKRDEIVGRTPFDLHLWESPEQRVALQEQLLATGNVRDLEFKVRRKDGHIFTALCSAELIEVNGESCALTVAADITDRKMAEEALAGVSRQLIEAQEAERTRIARELHDDVNQRLAMLAISLKTVKQELSLSEAQTSHRIEEACAQVSGLEDDIQALSHRLHSSGLEYLGLEAAVSDFCREVSERHNLSIQVRVDGVPQTLPDEASLCLFRVLQEAVHNAVKYSGVRDLEVSLTGGANEIELSVRDWGIGFDPETARHKHGLGLTSMRERLRLVNGQLSIESKPNHGTTILARVPLNASMPLDLRIPTTKSVA
jgi:PAS domain S-box-containing protein